MFGRKNEGEKEEDPEHRFHFHDRDGNADDRENEKLRRLMKGIEDFRNTDARDTMTRRSDISAIDAASSLADAVRMMLENAHTAYPVYEDNIDTILGILNFRSAIEAYMLRPEMRSRPVAEIRQLIMAASIYPESRPIGAILDDMRTEGTSLVIVVDEYGQTAGLLTRSDILEEISDSIIDEYDADISKGRKPGESFVLDGMTPLDEAEEVLRCDFGGADFETLSGYLTSLLGHIPTSADKSVKSSGYLFNILKVENHTISKVRAVRLPDEEGEKQCQDIPSSQT